MKGDKIVITMMDDAGYLPGLKGCLNPFLKKQGVTADLMIYQSGELATLKKVDKLRKDITERDSMITELNAELLMQEV